MNSEEIIKTNKRYWKSAVGADIPCYIMHGMVQVNYGELKVYCVIKN